MTNLRKAYPYGWTRKPTYEELDAIFDRCRELHQKAEKKIKQIETLFKKYEGSYDYNAMDEKDALEHFHTVFDELGIILGVEQ